MFVLCVTPTFVWHKHRSAYKTTHNSLSGNVYVQKRRKFAQQSSRKYSCMLLRQYWQPCSSRAVLTGNNAVEMETTATFDKQTDEFIVHTPSTVAQKYWITNSAVHAKWSAVFAQLLIDGTNHGIHGFLVRIRNEVSSSSSTCFQSCFGHCMSCFLHTVIFVHNQHATLSVALEFCIDAFLDGFCWMASTSHHSGPQSSAKSQSIGRTHPLQDTDQRQF